MRANPDSEAGSRPSSGVVSAGVPAGGVRGAAAAGAVAVRAVRVTRDAPAPSWDEVAARVLCSPKAVRKVLTGLRAMDANHTLDRAEWAGVRDQAANLGLHLWHRHHG
jgi:hypothetical protein